MYYNINMNIGEKPPTMSKAAAFSAVVDNACERLQDRQVTYSIQRLQEMEGRLAGLERELDVFLLGKAEQ
jgi:hypothetical protein